MHQDHVPYAKFTKRSQIDKSINSLLGIVEGISIDASINASELGFLNLWLSEHLELKDTHPYNELLPVVQAAVADGILSEEELKDILWLCERLRSAEYYDQTTADLQRLHAILGGIVADGLISENELQGLSVWLENHDHLKTCWPYDEIDSLITSVLINRKIDEQEHKVLKEFFTEFVKILDDKTITNPPITENSTSVGLCAVCPNIEFKGSRFCFTGASNRYTKSQLAEVVEKLGGEFTKSMSAKVSYLIIGADGNPCWAYACYGRKVEAAVKLRKSGVRLLIVHENDFHDAVADQR